jgi:predicted PurR-regulated permease PerM
MALVNLYKSPSDVNYSSFSAVPNYINEVSSGIFGWLLLVCIYIIFASGIAYYKKDITTGLAIAGFTTTIIAILFRILELINNVTLGITITVAVLGLIIFLFTKTKE